MERFHSASSANDHFTLLSTRPPLSTPPPIPRAPPCRRFRCVPLAHFAHELHICRRLRSRSSFCFIVSASRLSSSSASRRLIDKRQLIAALAPLVPQRVRDRARANGRPCAAACAPICPDIERVDRRSSKRNYPVSDNLMPFLWFAHASPPHIPAFRLPLATFFVFVCHFWPQLAPPPLQLR